MQTKRAVRLAFWMPKGGVGKTTDTLLLSLLTARRGKRVLAIDADPEAGLSRDILGPRLSSLSQHLKSFLESPVPGPPPILSTSIEGLSLLPCPPGEHRFFRLFPEHSPQLRDGLDFVEGSFDFIVLDLANQLDNLVHLGLAAVDYLILPVELTADCVDRIPMALDIIAEAKAGNPALTVLGALPLASRPQSGYPLRISRKERLLHAQYAAALETSGISLFHTIMYRTAASVEDARSNFDERLLHWTARRRFQALQAEILTRIKAASLPHSRHERSHNSARQARATTSATA